MYETATAGAVTIALRVVVTSAAAFLFKCCAIYLYTEYGN